MKSWYLRKILDIELDNFENDLDHIFDNCIREIRYAYHEIQASLCKERIMRERKENEEFAFSCLRYSLENSKEISVDRGLLLFKILNNVAVRNLFDYFEAEETRDLEWKIKTLSVAHALIDAPMIDLINIFEAQMNQYYR